MTRGSQLNKMVSGSCIINELRIVNEGHFFRCFSFFSKSKPPLGSKLGRNLCYDEEKLTVQDGVWVMHN